MLQEDYKQCSKTIMDNVADKGITFDKEGVSNYWYDYQKIAEEKLIHGEAGRQKWLNTISKIKELGKGKKYDCIIGVSGGVDSTYIAYLVKEAKLSPLVVHFDNGWNSEIAVQNINKIIDYLDADLYTLVVDWEEFRDLQRAYLKAGVIDIEAITDHAIIGALYRLAAKHNVKFVLSGSNIETEGILPKAWVHGKLDSLNIKDIHSKFGEVELKTYPFFSVLKKAYYLKYKKLSFLKPIDWAPYNKVKVKEVITKEIGWQDYGGKHHESVFTKFYQNYILPTKFKVDKRKAHLSTLICSKQLTKEQAIEELKESFYDLNQLATDKEYVIKKLGFTETEFDAILAEKPRAHQDFEVEGDIENHYPILKPLKKVYKIFR
ncbi:N-acetyl sugar amidotransferase [Vicingaceae bacterium]|nr:N-acetyl sugar amidotransferase [Vicingaceae bacterium]MDB4060491.1 N-acetyl sugar amidotransferase [Vicingaceae bacterium]